MLLGGPFPLARRGETETMRLKFVRKSDTHEQVADLAWSAGAPVLQSTDGEVGSGTGMGTPCSLVRLEVFGADSKVARAYVGARLNGRGQVKFEISAGRGKEVRKTLVAHWGPAHGVPSGQDAGEAREALARDVSARVDALVVETGLSREQVFLCLLEDLGMRREDLEGL